MDKTRINIESPPPYAPVNRNCVYEAKSQNQKKRISQQRIKAQADAYREDIREQSETIKRRLKKTETGSKETKNYKRVNGETERNGN